MRRRQAGKLVSRGNADVKSRIQHTQGVGTAATRAAVAGLSRSSWAMLRGLALVAAASVVAMAHEAPNQSVAALDAILDATVQVAVGAMIETPALPEQTPAAPPSAPVAESAVSAKALDLSPYAPGTIVVQTSERKLHLVMAHGEVVTYPVGVGKAGKAWSGTAYIRGKYIAPPWSPPKAVKREKPYLPDYIPGGVPSNPMGAAAMTLSVDQYAIHGTNVPSSIGTFASFGCIRMHNRDVLDLFKRVKVGTKVVVLN